MLKYPFTNTKSIDGGQSWGVYGPISNMITMAFDPTTTGVAYALKSNGIYKSTDSGANWGLSYATSASVGGTIAFDPKAAGVVFVSDDAGILRTTNGNTGWTRSFAGRFEKGVVSVMVDPVRISTVWAGVWGVTNNPGIYASTDNGGSWAPANTGVKELDLGALVANPQMPSTLYVNAPQLSKSTDGGATWLPMTSGLPFAAVSSIAVSETQPGTLYAALTRSSGPEVEEHDYSPCTGPRRRPRACTPASWSSTRTCPACLCVRVFECARLARRGHDVEHHLLAAALHLPFCGRRRTPIASMRWPIR